jgi:predicted Zn-dependent peptidase
MKMTKITETIKEMKGYRLHIIKTEKYKTNTFVWRMKAPLNKQEVTQRALLPYVMQSNTKKYPQTTLLRSYLDDLYGASLFVDVQKKGEYHVISFTLEIANEKFLSDRTPLLKKAVELLAEILMNPNAENGAFDRATVEAEKRALKQRIQSLYDDKMRYSSFRLIEEMCKDEPYSAYIHGQMEDVDPITPEALFQFYQKAFGEDEMDFYVIGDVNEEEVYSVADELLHFQPRNPKKIEASRIKKAIQEKEVREVQDVKQGKLNIGYRTHVVYGDDDYFALQVFNGIFGGFSHSKLFINVREKASLAYYAASRLESHKGLMMVMCGIDNKNYQQAVTIIKEQLDAMKKGDFSDEELEQTKAVIRNQILETIDTPRGIVEVLYHNVVAGKNISLDDWLEKMEQTTQEQIIEVAKKIELDTIYFLTEKEAGQ